MQLQLPTRGLDEYKSHSQRTRVATEAWGEKNLYCLNCNSDRLSPSPANTPAVDYACPVCQAPYQLKSQSHPFANRIVDSAYGSMLRSIQTGNTPHLMALHYEKNAWSVTNLLFVPRFAFTQTVLEKRKPLSKSARRAGWVGCNFLLNNIPLDARIFIVRNGAAAAVDDVRRQYARLKPLAEMKLEKRGWTLDVLNLIRSIGATDFSLADAYAFERQLSSLHPSNRHIRPKIRQQLQILRDLGLLEFFAPGHYRLR